MSLRLNASDIPSIGSTSAASQGGAAIGCTSSPEQSSFAAALARGKHYGDFAGAHAGSPKNSTSPGASHTREMSRRVAADTGAEDMPVLSVATLPLVAASAPFFASSTPELATDIPLASADSAAADNSAFEPAASLGTKPHTMLATLPSQITMLPLPQPPIPFALPETVPSPEATVASALDVKADAVGTAQLQQSGLNLVSAAPATDLATTPFTFLSQQVQPAVPHAIASEVDTVQTTTADAAAQLDLPQGSSLAAHNLPALTHTAQHLVDEVSASTVKPVAAAQSKIVNDVPANSATATGISVQDASELGKEASATPSANIAVIGPNTAHVSAQPEPLTPVTRAEASALPIASGLLQEAIQISASSSLGGGSSQTDDSGDEQSADRTGRKIQIEGLEMPTSQAARFGMGEWMPSTQSGTPPSPTSGSPEARLASDGGMVQLAMDRVASDSSARRVTSALQSELGFGVQTDSFGRVHIQTSMLGSQLSAQISLERAHAGTAVLAAQMPVLEGRLADKFGIESTVSVRADAGSMAGGSQSSSNQGSNNQSSDRQAAASYAASPVHSASGHIAIASVPVPASTLWSAPPLSSGRLDITI